MHIFPSRRIFENNKSIFWISPVVYFLVSLCWGNRYLSTVDFFISSRIGPRKMFCSFCQWKIECVSFVKIQSFYTILFDSIVMFILASVLSFWILRIFITSLHLCWTGFSLYFGNIEKITRTWPSSFFLGPNSSQKCPVGE